MGKQPTPQQYETNAIRCIMPSYSPETPNGIVFKSILEEFSREDGLDFRYVCKKACEKVHPRSRSPFLEDRTPAMIGFYLGHLVRRGILKIKAQENMAQYYKTQSGEARISMIYGPSAGTVQPN